MNSLYNSSDPNLPSRPKMQYKRNYIGLSYKCPIIVIYNPPYNYLEYNSTVEGKSRLKNI